MTYVCMYTHVYVFYVCVCMCICPYFGQWCWSGMYDVCMYVCTCICIVFMCVYVYVDVRILDTYIHTYMHAYQLSNIRTYTYIHTHTIHTHVYTYIHASYIRPNTTVQNTNIYIHTHIHIQYIYIYIHTYIRRHDPTTCTTTMSRLHHDPTYIYTYIHTYAGMTLQNALQLCPALITIPYEFDKYTEVAETMYRTLFDISAHVEGVSCDEAYLDVTGLINECNNGADMRVYMQRVEGILRMVREKVRAATGCDVSAGVYVCLYMYVRIRIHVCGERGGQGCDRV
jgi:hypothetical protein